MLIPNKKYFLLPYCNGQLLQSNKPVNNVKIPFHVRLNGNDATIYINPPLVRPYFDGADGIVIQHEKGTTTAQIIFPGH